MIGVIGATGRIGTHLSQTLGEDGAEAVALVRREPSSPIGIPLRQADLRNRDQLTEAMGGVDRLFLLTPHGPDQDLLEANAISAAGAAGVKSIVKVSGTPATLSPNGPTSTAVTHWRSERLIEAGGFRFAHIRPSFMMQNLLGTLSPVVRKTGKVITPFGDEPIAMVDLRDVADCAAGLLETDEPGDRAFHLTGPAPVTHRGIAGLLGTKLLRIPGPFVSRAVASRMESGWEADHALRMFNFYASGADGLVSTDVLAMTARNPRSIGAFLDEEEDRFRKIEKKEVPE